MSSIQENIIEEETQEEIQERLKQKVEALDGKCMGVQKYYNITKWELEQQKKKNKIAVQVILETKNLEVIEKYLDRVGGTWRLVQAYCREGEYKNKKGFISKCWYAGEKYAGAINKKNKDTPPTFYISTPYKRENFNFNIEKNGWNMFEYKFDTIDCGNYTFKVKK